MDKPSTPLFRRPAAIAAGVGLLLYIVSRVIGDASLQQTAVCKAGGSCAAFHAHNLIGLAGGLAGTGAICIGVIALVRGLRRRRRAAQ
jgi:hypothetical protein